MQTDASPTWDDLRVLLALHRHRSFLAAGKALGVSTSTAARRIEALEAALGRPLVHRSSAGTSVEPDALELVSLAEQLELGLSVVRRDEGDAVLAGTVRISMGEAFVRPATQFLSEVRRKHPSIQLEIISETRMVDLGRREADIAIRKGKSSSPVVVDRNVGRLRFGLYAAPSYVDRRLRGGQLAVADLPRHDFIGHDQRREATLFQRGAHPAGRALAKFVQTEWLASRGATRFVFRSNSDVALLEATVQGQGIAMLADAATRGVSGLVRLDVDAELPSAPLYLSFHRELRSVPRVRLVIDALDRALRDGLR